MERTEKKSNKISHTVFPNGHLIRWCLVDVDDMFGYNKYGDRIFAWFSLFKKTEKPNQES